MGIDIEGGMLVGAHGSELEVPEGYDGSLYEWVNSKRLVGMREYYDADEDSTYYGFYVEDILVKDIDDDWVKEIKELGEKFEKLTGVGASLIGVQDVY